MKVTKLIVGCPTRNRTWILDKWRDHVEQATPGDWDLEYAFVVGQDDKQTLDLLTEWSRTTIILVDEPVIDETRTWWEPSRLDHMAEIRNLLLRHVRDEKPDLFLSLDSDILIGQDTLRNMFDTMREYGFNAVGGLTWLDPMDRLCTSVGRWGNQSQKFFKRVHSHGTHEADIIMAIKLMDTKAYNIDYDGDKLGEDIAWCRNVKAAGHAIGFDGRSPSKHVMSPEALDRIDKRVGW